MISSGTGNRGNTMRMQFVLAICCALLLAAAAQAEPLVNLRLEVDDLTGSPISSVKIGDSFQLKMYAQDIRLPESDTPGVFAAFENVAYDAGLVSTVGAVVHAPTYPLTADGDLSTSGLIAHAGGATLSFTPLGPDEKEVWSLTFLANQVGVAAFSPSFDGSPTHEVLLYGINDAIESNQIQFAGAVIDIVTNVPEPTGCILAVLGGFVLLGNISRRNRR
jgi:hypothetical protein